MVDAASSTEEPKEQKSALKEDWDASGYWREFQDGDSRKEPGLKGFIKEEVEATGYFKHHPDKYPTNEA